MQPWLIPHMQKALLGLVLCVIITFLPARLLFRTAYLIYAGGIMLLILVHLIGMEGGLGAKRWLNIAGFQFQPSECMKIALIVMIAHYMHVIHPEARRRYRILVPLALLIMVPILLVLLQPNLGTSMILMGMVGGILFIAGIGWQKFVIIGLLICAALPVGWFQLHDYQKQRVMTFINPESDPQGAGYNIIQSKIAIGSGGLVGKGFLQGTQSQLEFVPENQTDFVFTVISEEFGWLGVILALILYGYLFIYTLYRASKMQTQFFTLLASGAAIFMFLHVLINTLMVAGWLPVVGIPLPFISFGGTHLLICYMAIGCILHACIHENAEIPRTRI